MTAIYAVILFVLLIFPHELGHFVAAKSVGVKVNEFAFGMGPAIYQKQGKETLYSIRLIPIGGFCAMEGEDEESDAEGAFNNKPGWAKILVLVAGSAMNVLIAILFMSIMICISGSITTTVDQITPDSPAYEAGMQSGDKLISIDDKNIRSWSDLSASMPQEARTVQLTVRRDGQDVMLTMTPVLDEEQQRYIIGITPAVTHSPVLAVKNGLISTWNITGLMIDSLKMIVTGKASTDDISGPVGIISVVSQTKDYGMNFFFYLLALMSMNLAIINMLPLPALDGGRIIFVIIRAVTGKAITDEMEGKVHAIGMILLFALMILITYKDIMRLFQ